VRGAKAVQRGLHTAEDVVADPVADVHDECTVA
jgi:hypothetical protein